MTKGLKILQVSGGRIPIPPVGAFGAEQVIHALSVALTESGHHVTLLDAPGSRPPVPYQVVEVPAGPQGHISLPGALVRGLVFGLNVRGKLQELLRHERFDVVTFHFQFPALFGASVARRHNVPTVYWVHSPHWGTRKAAGGWANKARFWPERKVLRSIDKIALATRATADNVVGELGLSADRVEILPLGLEEEWFLPSSSPGVSCSDHAPDRNGPVILNVGNIHPRKNQEALVRAAPLVLQQVSDAKFVFAGAVTDQGYFKRLQCVANENGISERVRFLGEVPRDRIRQLYHSSSLFVFTSLAETFGVVLLEAMASRLPIVLAAPGVSPEVVPHNCAVFPVVGDRTALATAICDLLASPDERTRLGEAEWGYASATYRWSAVVGRFVALYQHPNR